MEQAGLVTEGPVDATTTEAWRGSAPLADGFAPDLRAWFAEDAERGVERPDLHRGGPACRPVQGAGRRRGAGRAARTGRARSGSPTVATRCSAATASTSPRTAPCCTPRCGCRRAPTLEVDGQDVVADVHEVLRRVYDFADQVRTGAWTGVTGERIRTVVNIGIGGSDLGPVMAYEALAPYRQAGLECRFISNIDPTDAATTLAGLDPAKHAVHRLQQDLRHARDAHQRPALQGLAARRPERPGREGRRRRATSSRSPRRSTRSPTSASTPTTRSASGTGSAAATRWTRRSARRSWWRSGRSGSPSCSPASTPWTSTSARPSRRATCRC